MTDDPAVPGALESLIQQWRIHAWEYRDAAEPDDTYGRDKARAEILDKCARELEAALLAARREPPPETEE